uniref:A-kinase anchor protein 9 n=1 Tax=Anisakis simplex TaxID=6269 RepID=A0A0M3KGY5_ANISI
LAEKQRIIERQSAEINELKRQYQTEIDRLKAELVNLENKYQNELEDERDQHQREIEALRAEQDDLRSKIQVLEKRLEECLAREKLLQKENLSVLNLIRFRHAIDSGKNLFSRNVSAVLHASTVLNSRNVLT